MKRWHPIVNILYFIRVISFAMVLNNPLCMFISFVGACICFVRLKGVKSFWRNSVYIVPILLLTICINPLFSHQGVTILAYFPNGNPLTLESIWFGVGMAGLLLTVMVWFLSVNIIMTTDKILYVFGRIVPSLSLALSMTLRFVPRFVARFREIRSHQLCYEKAMTTIGKVKQGTTILSATITWALEDAVCTSDSMRCRGYGLPGRTSYSRFILSRNDKRRMVAILGLDILLIFFIIKEYFYFQYYPYVFLENSSVGCVFAYIVYAGLCFIFFERGYKYEE